MLPKCSKSRGIAKNPWGHQRKGKASWKKKLHWDLMSKYEFTKETKGQGQEKEPFEYWDVKKIGEMLKYKMQAGMRVPFQSAWYFSPLWAFITTTKPKRRPNGKVCFTNSCKHCQQEVLSLQRPHLSQGRHWGWGWGHFSPWRPLCESEEAYGSRVWCSAFSCDHLLGSDI